MSCLRPLAHSVKPAEVAEELVRVNERDVEVAEQCEPVPAGRFGGGHVGGSELGDMVGVSASQRIGTAVVDVESRLAQFVGETSHRRDDEVGPLPVPALPGELRSALDHRHAM